MPQVLLCNCTGKQVLLRVQMPFMLTRLGRVLFCMFLDSELALFDSSARSMQLAFMQRS